MFFFKPAWMSDKEAKALKAVKKEDNQAELVEMARKAPLKVTRKAALHKLTDQSILADMAQNDESADVRIAAIKNLADQSVLTSIARQDADKEVCLAAIKKLTDQDSLAYMALNSPVNFIATSDAEDLCLAAAEQLTDPALIADIAKSGGYVKVCLRALGKLTGQDAFADIAINGTKGRVCLMAAEKLADKALQRQAYVHIAKYKPFYAGENPLAVLDKLSDREDLLTDIALEKQTPARVRLALADRLSDQKTLCELIKKFPKDTELFDCAIKGLTDQDILLDIANNAVYESYRAKAAERLTDKTAAQEVYADIAKNGQSGFSRKCAADQLTDQAAAQRVYADIIENETDSFTRTYAMSSLTDPNELASIAKSA